MTAAAQKKTLKKVAALAKAIQKFADTFEKPAVTHTGRGIDDANASKIMDTFLSESDRKCIHEVMKTSGKSAPEILAEIAQAGFKTMEQEVMANA